MKKLLCLSLICCWFVAATATFAAEKGVKVKDWNHVQTVDVATLKKTIDSRVRHIVAIHFNGRGKDIHHLKPNWYQGTIWQPGPDGKGFVQVQVMVAKKDLSAFKAINTSTEGSQEMTIYGEILRDSERQTFVFARLLGRNAAPDDKGNATITW